MTTDKRFEEDLSEAEFAALEAYRERKAICLESGEPEAVAERLARESADRVSRTYAQGKEKLV